MDVRKILIVEDDEAIIFSLEQRFETRNDIKILSAKNGSLGLSIALTEKPDLILLDIIMPVMDGLELLKALRKDAWGKNANVIILSNLSDPKKEAETRKLGVRNYIIKAEYTLDDVAAIIEKQLQK